jgi:hypothetical protein
VIRIPPIASIFALALALTACTAGRTTVDAGTDARMTIDLDAIVPGDMGATHCDPGMINCSGVCTHVASDPMNCGSCGNACPVGVGCAIGECTCHAPMLACDGLCIDPQSDHDHCGACGHACDATQVCSLGECIVMCTAAHHEVCVATDTSGMRTQVCADLMSDSNNCGTCNTHCAGGATCYMGSCQCPAGERACSGTCTDVSSDPLNCGSCLSSCGGADGTCYLGVCTACGGGGTLCGSPARCYDTMTSTLHCGMCGHACPGGAVCTAGTCACPGGATACGMSCVDTMLDPHNCGSCGHVCQAMSTCTAGGCECSTGLSDCSGVCVNEQTDIHNCGGCGTDCGPGGACDAGTCTCAPGFTMCGGACADLMTSELYCGNCATSCGTGMACHMGVCEAVDSFRVLTMSATGCTTVDTGASNDDRGGVAISPSTFFVTADGSTLRMSATDLSGSTTIGAVQDGIFEDLESQRVFVLLSASSTQPSWFGSAITITQIGELDPATGLLTATRIPLSAPINLPSSTSNVAMMSGYGEMLIGIPGTSTIQWTQIELPTGMVTTLGTSQIPTHRTCENWAWWGIAERAGGNHSVVYVESTTQISRMVVPDTGASTAAPTAVATFTNLGDMCSITFSTTRNRWYFHHEYNSQFTPASFNETAGFCPGTWDRP